MSVRDQLYKMTEGEEGRKATAYKDSRGFDTIGVGFCIDARVKGAGLPDAIISMLHAWKIDQVLAALDQRIPWWRDEPNNVQLALADMAFQMGVDGMLGFHNMLSAISAGNYTLAHKEALDSDWARQTPDRAQRVAARLLAVGTVA